MTSNIYLINRAYETISSTKKIPSTFHVHIMNKKQEINRKTFIQKVSVALSNLCIFKLEGSLHKMKLPILISFNYTLRAHFILLLPPTYIYINPINTLLSIQLKVIVHCLYNVSLILLKSIKGTF